MTQKIPKTASSPLPKIGYLPLILVVLAMEIITLSVLYAAMEPYAPKVLAKTAQRDPQVPSLVRYLEISTPEKSWTVDDDNWNEFWDLETLGAWLLEQEKILNREPQDAELELKDGESRATKFAPHQDGQTLGLAEAQSLIRKALLEGRSEVELPVSVKPPRVTLSDLNSLGIKEIIARGQSDFSGSPANRIQNIKVGTARYHGVVIMPGEEFAFNKHLGPIDAAHGFLPELVIKPEGTVPEFGGGLCQVSSTAFRAAFFGGLPITQRRNHSYAVKYYEWISDDRASAVGLDATIYPGAQDLKFINDTPGAILIATKVEGKRVYFDFYGTSDGRKVIVDGPHPYDKKASGAVKSKVTRVVAKSGEEPVEITLRSNYVSPNLYPRTTYQQPAEPAPAPAPTPQPEQSNNSNG